MSLIPAVLGRSIRKIFCLSERVAATLSDKIDLDGLVCLFNFTNYVTEMFAEVLKVLWF